jgi:hypothetical protein
MSANSYTVTTSLLISVRSHEWLSLKTDDDVTLSLQQLALKDRTRPRIL